MNLIEHVLKIDKEATQGPWIYEPGRGYDCETEDAYPTIGVRKDVLFPEHVNDPLYTDTHDFYRKSRKGNENGRKVKPWRVHAKADTTVFTNRSLELISLYRTAAPKLARAVYKAKKKLAVLERLAVGGAIGDIAREILAEIEKELA